MIKAPQLNNYNRYCELIAKALRRAFNHIEEHYSKEKELIAEKQGATLQRILNDPFDFGSIHFWLEDTDWLDDEESSMLINEFLEITKDADFSHR